MEKNIKIKEKNNNPAFAFLPDMVLEHLNYATLSEIQEISNKPIKKKMQYPFDFQDPILEPIIENTKEIKRVEVVEKSFFETQNSPTKENTIKRFLKKIKLY